MSQAELDIVMRQATADAPAVWLIASEVPMWDERDLTATWLRDHGIATHHAEFARVAVTRYRLH
jgi:hypothetical protein